MYAVTSYPLVSRTRATLRSAEFGFFGVVVYTRVQTPRRWGAPFSAGVLLLLCLVARPLRTSWAMVGNVPFQTCVVTRPANSAATAGRPGVRAATAAPDGRPA